MEAGPVVTVVDPLHPERFAPLPDARVRRTWRPLERLLATAVALLLVAGLSTSARLRDERQADEALQRVRLSGSAVEAVLSARGDSVTVLLLVDTTADVTVRDLSGAGWRSTFGSVDLPAAGLPGVPVTQAIDCAVPPAVPGAFDVRASAGGAHGRVPLTVTNVLPAVRQTLRAACGDLDADESLLLDGSSLERGPQQVTVGLRLRNAGAQPLRVLAVRYPGFAVVSRPTLPLSLAGSVVQVPASGRTPLPVQATLRMVLQECGSARAALDASRNSGLVDLLEVDVDGRGGRGTVRLDVRGVLAYLEQAWQEGCV